MYDVEAKMATEGVEAAECETEARYAINSIERTVTDLADLVELLEQRLGHVLRSAPPEESDAQIARAIETKHAAELRDIEGRVGRTRNAVRSILDRLEI